MSKTARQFHSRWFRVYDESVDDPKLQMLSDKQHRFLFNCWCMASKNGGYIPPVPEIAWRLRLPESKVAALIADLHERNLLEREADTFTPHNWSNRQFDSDVSTGRVRAFRERQRNSQGTYTELDETVSATVSETAPDTDTETETDTYTENPQTPAPKNGACVDIAQRNSEPNSRKRRAPRTTEEIRAALGDRLPWWENFWKEFPCHEAMNEAMDAFERKIHTRDVAVAVFQGAKAYAARARADPTMKLKYGQGWINRERWTDENKIIAPSASLVGGRDHQKRQEELALLNVMDQVRQQ